MEARNGLKIRSVINRVRVRVPQPAPKEIIMKNTVFLPAVAVLLAGMSACLHFVNIQNNKKLVAYYEDKLVTQASELRQENIENIQTVHNECETEKIQMWQDGWEKGYRDSIIDTFYLTNKYVIDDKSNPEGAILWLKQEILPIHQGVK
jgi:hypothetical protein